MVESKTCGSWAPRSTAALTSSWRWSRRSWGPIRASPPWRSRNRTSSWARVVLPDPDGPDRTTRPPAGRSSDTPSSTRRRSGPRSTTTWSSAIPGRRDGAGAGRAGSATSGSRSISSRTRRPAASTAGSWRAAVDRGSTASNAPTATRVRGATSSGSSAPRPAAAVVAARIARVVRAADGDADRVGRPGGPGVAEGHLDQRPVGGGDAGGGPPVGPVQPQLVGRVQGVDQVGGEPRPQRRLAPLGARHRPGRDQRPERRRRRPARRRAGRRRSGSTTSTPPTMTAPATSATPTGSTSRRATSWSWSTSATIRLSSSPSR